MGDAKLFLDLMVNQSPTGELEVLQGKSSYTFAGNWKLQNENGLDGYHVSAVHYNYVLQFNTVSKSMHQRCRTRHARLQ